MTASLVERWGLPPVRRQWPLVTAMAVDTLGTGLYLPFTLLYFLATTSLPVTRIGLAMAIATGASLPLGPVWGACADRWSPRTVIVISNLLRVVGFTGYLAVRSFPALVITAFVVQVGSRAFYSSYTPLIAQVAPRGQRERWFGFLSATRNTGFALGGVLAGIAVTGAGTIGYRAVVLANAASFALAAFLMLKVKTHAQPQHGQVAAHGGWRAVLADRPYLALTVVNLAFALASNTIDVVLPVYLVRWLGLPAWTAGASLGLNCVLVATCQGPVVRLVEGRRRPRLLILSGALTAAAAGVFLAAKPLPAAPALALIVIGVVVFSVGELVQSPVMAVLSAEAAPDALRGRYISLFQLSWTVSNTAGLAVLSWLLGVGALATWGFLACVALSGSAGIGLVGPRLRFGAAAPDEASAAALTPEPQPGD